MRPTVLQNVRGIIAISLLYFAASIYPGGNHQQDIQKDKLLTFLKCFLKDESYV